MLLRGFPKATIQHMSQHLETHEIGSAAQSRFSQVYKTERSRLAQSIISLGQVKQLFQ